MLRALSTLRRRRVDVGTVPAMPRLWIGGDHQASNARYPGQDQKRVALRTDIGEHRHQQPDLGPDGAGRLAWRRSAMLVWDTSRCAWILSVAPASAPVLVAGL